MSDLAKNEKAASPLAKDAAFEDIVARIEKIASTLEGGEAKLEEALSLFEEGMKLCQRGTTRLDEAERKVDLLLDDNRTQPLAEDALKERG